MTSPRMLFLWLLVIAPAMAADAASPQTQPAKVDYRDRYSVLSDRNMFLRDRRRPVYTREPTSRPVYVSRPVEETLILTGVVFEEGEYRAYFEDTTRSSILRLRVGESVGQGIITQIQMDAIEYLTGERRAWIDVGRTLTGAAPALPSYSPTISALPTASATTGSTTQPATASGTTTTPLPNPNDPNLSLEERMRLRRAQELNR